MSFEIFIAGYLADRFCAKYVFGVGAFISNMMSFSIPMASYLHVNALAVVRGTMGAGQGFCLSALATLVG